MSSSTGPGRPDERIGPAPAALTDHVVPFGFPSASGLQGRLEASGYNVHRSAENMVSIRKLEGWEIVRERDDRGIWHSYRCP
jgi:hypothetical protein